MGLAAADNIRRNVLPQPGVVLGVRPSAVDVNKSVQICPLFGAVVVQMDGVGLHQVTWFGCIWSWQWRSPLALPLLANH